MGLFLILAASLAATGEGAPIAPPAVLRYEPQCILRAVAWHMGFNPRWDIPLPALRYESRTPLRDFQDAIETQWGLRPDAFTNAFAERSNEIFLIDEARYYAKLRRFIDDSLAHEYAHYVQFHYRKQHMVPEDDTLEYEAIAVQTWFRDTYFRSPAPVPDPCRPGP